MSFRKIVEEAVSILNCTFEYNSESNTYTLKIVFDDDSVEVVQVYQDTFEDESEGINRKTVVCESFVCNYSGNKDLLFLAKSNNDLFFSKACISGENGMEKVIVESCTFLEGLTALNLSVIIDEISQHTQHLKENF